VTAHVWEIEEVESDLGVGRFWKCKACGASGGPIGGPLGDKHGEPPPTMSPFLAGRNLKLPDDCEEAKVLVNGFMKGAPLSHEEMELIVRLRDVTGTDPAWNVDGVTYVYLAYDGKQRTRTINFKDFKERKHALRQAVRDARLDHNPRGARG